MEKFQDLRDKAKQNIHLADHMLTMTYPLLDDPKILVSVLGNIQAAINNSLTSVLEYERLFKRIPPYTDSTEGKIRMFREIAPKHKISPEHIRLIQKVKELTTAHKDSTMEFARKDKFVMATENYEIRTLNVTQLKELIFKAKIFINEMARITIQNDGLFR